MTGSPIRDRVVSNRSHPIKARVNVLDDLGPAEAITCPRCGRANAALHKNGAGALCSVASRLAATPQYTLDEMLEYQEHQESSRHNWRRYDL